MLLIADCGSTKVDWRAIAADGTVKSVNTEGINPVFLSSEDISKILEEDYKYSFQFYYLLGVACLYQGDIGGAETWFKSARRIKMNDVKLILGQAAIFLKKGKMSQAIEYYVDAKNLEPDNQKVQQYLDLLKKYGDIDTISEWSLNGKIKIFYPELPKKSPMIPIFVSIVCFGSLKNLYFVSFHNLRMLYLSH